VKTETDGAHLTDELDLLPLDLLHHHDLHLVEEVQGEVAQSVSENTDSSSLATLPCVRRSTPASYFCVT